MNLKSIQLVAVFLFFLGLSACSLTNRKPVTASVSTPTSSGSALAFQADNKFGGNLSSADRASLQAAERQALDYGKSGEEISWKGKSEAISGTIKAYQPFRVGQANCRRFEHEIKGTTGASTTNGTACLREDGAWRLVK